jgi:hypothetical protein
MVFAKLQVIDIAEFIFAAAKTRRPRLLLLVALL